MSEKVFYNNQWVDLQRISYSSIPVGTVIWSMAASVPAGFLLCNGATVGRSTYPDLADALGISSSAETFQLPNLIDKFIEGSNVAGVVKDAGLPNITGEYKAIGNYSIFWAGSAGGGISCTGAFSGDTDGQRSNSSAQSGNAPSRLLFDASRSSSIYGNSNTVQPPSVTALPCIKAFSSVNGDATVVAGQLVNEIQSKVSLDGSNTSSIGSTLSTYMANAAMPSGQYEDLTLPASGGTVTAPADGWVLFSRNVTNSGQYITLATASRVASEIVAHSSGQTITTFVPVKNGETISVYYTAAGSAVDLHFVYANGSYTS